MCLVVCVTSVLCPCGWCCIHLSVTQKQMSPGRWGAADCCSDWLVAGWRCLRPTVPSRWKLRSLSAALYISVLPHPNPPPTPFYWVALANWDVSTTENCRRYYCTFNSHYHQVSCHNLQASMLTKTWTKDADHTDHSDLPAGHWFSSFWVWVWLSNKQVPNDHSL